MKIDIENIKKDKEILDIIKIFKAVKDKQKIADTLAKEAVNVGLKQSNPILLHYYGDVDLDFVIMSCISFGLMNLMIEDFYVVKGVLGFNNVLKLLQNQEKYMILVK